MLSLDLPPTPLFTEEEEENIIPQVPLTTLLAKYVGETSTVYGDQVKRYRLKKLSKYVIFCIRRFSKNSFTEEKNPTIVNFPLKQLDLSSCIEN